MPMETAAKFIAAAACLVSGSLAAFECVDAAKAKARDGRCAAVLVNWTRECADYDLSTPEVSAKGTLPPRTWRLVPATDGRQ